MEFGLGGCILDKGNGLYRCQKEACPGHSPKMVFFILPSLQTVDLSDFFNDY